MAGPAESRVAVAAATPPTPSAEARPRFSLRTFESLRLGPYRWLFASMLGQMAAMHMQLMVRGYLAFTLTGSFSAVGLVGLASALPMLSLSLVGGVLADRRSKKRLLQAGQASSAVFALAVALLLVTDQLQFWHLIVFSLVQGAVFALVLPSSQAIVPEIVGRSSLMNAISLNAAGVNLTRLLAPAAGGFLIALLGVEAVYFLMAGLYVFALSTMARVPLRGGGGEGITRRAESRGLDDMVEGIRYILSNRVVFLVLGANFAITILAMPYMMILPGYVLDVFEGDASDLGLLIAISGAGALLGSLVVASLPPRRRGLLLLFSAMLLGVGLLAFTTTTSIWLAAAFMAVVGVGSAGRQAFGTVLLMTNVDEGYHGRVMAVFMTQVSLMLLAAFFVGILAEVIGAPQALGALSVALIAVSAALIAFSPLLRELQ